MAEKPGGPGGPAGADAFVRRAPMPNADPEGSKRLLADESFTFAPATYDAEKGEVDVTWSTGVAVRRYDWWSDKPYDEELDLGGAKLERLNAGAPLLLDHWNRVASVVGSVMPGTARVESGVGVARLRFDRGSEEGKAAEAKVAGGHIRSVSAGYTVRTWEKIETDGQVMRWIARDWEPFELSLVGAPADAGATFRGAPSAPPATPSTPQGAQTPAPMEARMADRTENSGAPSAPAANPPAAPDANAAVQAERQRSAEIRKRCRALSLGDEFAEQLVNDGVTLDQAATRIVDKLAENSPKPPKGPIAEVGASHDEPVSVRNAMADAIAIRFMPGHKPTDDRFRQYAGWRMSDMSAELMRLRGISVDPRNRLDIAERSFHTTSDFPLLMAAATNRMLRVGYAQAVPTYRAFMQRKTFQDFTPHAFLNVGDFPTLLKYGEGGEIKVGTISESAEKVQLASYGRRLRVTRQMLINDQLGAFADFGAMIGRRISEFENTAAYAVVNANNGDGPALSDGKTVFHADHGNKAGAGSAITVKSVGAGRAAVRKQKNQDKTPLNLAPRILLTGADKELEAEQLLAAVQAQQIGNVNPFAGRLTPVSDANIEGHRWYLFADPDAAPVYVYGYLDGAEGPQVTTANPHEHDGTDIKVIMDFAVGAIDYRGAWEDPGAAAA
jgi:hypothetical protein